MTLRVLVVDDSEVMRSMLIRVLRLSAVPVSAVYQAGSADEAIQVLRRESVDLALVDQHVGDARGIDLLERLKAEAAYAPPAAILTVGLEPDDAPSGVVSLRKPFTPDQLRAAMLRVLVAAAAEAR